MDPPVELEELLLQRAAPCTLEPRPQKGFRVFLFRVGLRASGTWANALATRLAASAWQRHLLKLQLARPVLSPTAWASNAEF